jgi:adenine phosphoribosyltransferase
MRDPVEVDVKSITTSNIQRLYLDRDDQEYLNGKRVLVVDDVISTGGSLRALQALVQKSGGQVVGSAAVLAEGDAAKRDDILFLEPLPLFTK